MSLSKPVIISFYINKGGAAKTTHSVLLACILASMGYKVLFVDGDRQYDATKSIHLNKMLPSSPEFDGFEHYLNQDLSDEDIKNETPRNLFETIEEFRRNNKERTIRAAVSKLVFNWSNGGAFWLLPGHPDLAEWDGYLSAAPNFFKTLPYFRNFPGLIYHAICLAANNLKTSDGRVESADFVVIDMSANPGPLNGCLYMSSHFTIMPVVPECQTVNDIDVTLKTIIKWHDMADKYVKVSKGKTLYPFPDHFPKFIGYVMGKYDIGGFSNDGTKGKGSIGENGIVENDAVAGNIKVLFGYADRKITNAVPILKNLKHSLIIDDQKLFNLANIRTFNQFGQSSQLLGIPICFLTKDDMVSFNINGEIEKMIPLNVAKNMAEIEKFRNIYEAMANNVIKNILKTGMKIKEPLKSKPLQVFPDYVIEMRKKFIQQNHKKRFHEMKQPKTPEVISPETDPVDNEPFVQERQIVVRLKRGRWLSDDE